jgi:hypothetical protein
MAQYPSNSTAQITTLNDEGAPKDQITGACITGTEPCNQVNSSVSGEQSDSVMSRLLVEASKQVHVFISKLSTTTNDLVREICDNLQTISATGKHEGVALRGVCDPFTGKCVPPKKDRSVSISRSAAMAVVNSENGKMDVPMLSVCVPNGPCYNNHHG